uniref:Uncharacterized protein n=1 Tax=Picea glauca TaxID=3330 RepID=A0A101M4W7_PICGL|nr:hypothetical protein ABT39_MTgene845 [Picea glauca]QHR88317.1 hypothetical protein Q903MT_gene2330 [Picea sitchensis]
MFNLPLRWLTFTFFKHFLIRLYQLFQLLLLLVVPYLQRCTNLHLTFFSLFLFSKKQQYRLLVCTDPAS